MSYTRIAGQSLPGIIGESRRKLLDCCGLRDEGGADLTVVYLDDSGEAVACGSLHGTVIKQIAVAPEAEGEGLCAALVSELEDAAVSRGDSHLFLFTKPSRQKTFEQLGFTPLAATDRMAMMENRPDGLQRFLAAIPRPDGTTGAVVCNCNPFTKGHRFLIEQASACCDTLLIFVLSEEQPPFRAEERFRLVEEGCADLPKVRVLRGGAYLISRATFPTYFIKEQAEAEEAACELDAALFAQRIAPSLGIVKRFVGAEPIDAVTRVYNEVLKRMLPAQGVEVIEFPRYRNISASTVRRLLSEGRIRETRDSLQENVYAFCERKFGAGSGLS